MIDIKEIKVNIALLKRKIGFDVSGQQAISNIEEALTKLERLQKKEEPYKYALSLNHKQAIEVIDIITEHGALLVFPLDIRIDYLKVQNKAKEWINKIRSDEK
jgi:hypothetical protein